MIAYERLWQALATTPLANWHALLQQRLAEALDPASHGDLPQWYQILAALPPLTPTSIDLNSDCLQIGSASDIDAASRDRLTTLLQQLHPWRKGPFCLFGIHLDTEWRSDWKWNRIREHIDLRGKTVLDVGCGNGYYGWRMLGAGAQLVLGVDPTLRYVMQYAMMRHYLDSMDNYVLPLRFEELPEHGAAFDVAFSMGVIYHRRDPLEHLRRLHGQLRSGGQLLLEGLVIAGEDDAVLHPAGRYAKMKNVHAIPTVTLLQRWLQDAGYEEIRTLDVSVTTRQEQRRTGWMRFESLADFLDQNDPGLTVEGYPAPVRASIHARKG